MIPGAVFCDICQQETWGSHYHCANCGGESSMLGHYVMGVFECEYKEGPWNVGELLPAETEGGERHEELAEASVDKD